MIELIGRMVEVRTGDMTYTGKLVEIGEEDIYLQSQEGWIVLPVDRVASIIEKEKD